MAEPPVAMEPAPPPPLARFTQPHEVFVLMTEGGRTACRPWSVQPPNEDGLVELRGEGESLWVETHGAQLTVVDRSFRHHDAVQSLSCGRTFGVREVDGGLDLDGARWFDRAADCRQALATRQRVAMTLDCEVPPTSTEVAAARTAFERILRRGGRLWAVVDDACMATNVTASRGAPGELEGYLWTATREGKLRGKHGYNYQMTAGRDEIAILGPSWTYSDGSGGGMGCGDIEQLRFLPDAVELGQTHYLTKRACTRAIRDERERMRWLPPAPTGDDDGDEDDAGWAGTARPAVGGC